MKVLVIESDRNLLNSLERFLKTKDCVVKSVFDGVIGINEFEEDTDVLLIDSASPRISPLELVDTLKKKKESLKIVLIVDNGFITSKTLIENTNINEFITKPFLVNALDWLFSQINLEKLDKEKSFMTYKERYLLKHIKGDEIDYQNIDYDIIKKEEINEYIKAIKYKAERKDTHV